MTARTVARFEVETSLDVADAVTTILLAIRATPTDSDMRCISIDASRVVTFEVAK